jgi:hypothetical protein
MMHAHRRYRHMKRSYRQASQVGQPTRNASWCQPATTDTHKCLMQPPRNPISPPISSCTEVSLPGSARDWLIQLSTRPNLNTLGEPTVGLLSPSKQQMVR